MTKRELIDEITMRNPTAKPEFLSSFAEADLGAYLDHLIVARRPRLSGGGDRYAKYFTNSDRLAQCEQTPAWTRLPASTSPTEPQAPIVQPPVEKQAAQSPLPPQEEAEPVRVTQPALFTPAQEATPAEEVTPAPLAAEPELEPQVHADEPAEIEMQETIEAIAAAPQAIEKESPATEEPLPAAEIPEPSVEMPATESQEDEIEYRPIEVYHEPIEYVPVEDSVIDPFENELADPVDQYPVENTSRELAAETYTETAPELASEHTTPVELVRAKRTRSRRPHKEQPVEQEQEQETLEDIASPAQSEPQAVTVGAPSESSSENNDSWLF
jgi:hypothetical protein